MPPLYKITHIGRPVDPKYPTNLAILIVIPSAAAAFAGLMLARHWSVGYALERGATAGALAFLAWALGRELAPDENASAFVAVAFALGALMYHPDADILLLALTLLLVRVVNRTVGLPAKFSDLLAVEALVIYITYSRAEWGMGLVAAAAFAFDALLDRPQSGGIIFAVVAAAAAIIPAASAGALSLTLLFERVVRSRADWYLAAGIALPFLAAIAAQPPLVVACDLTTSPPRCARVQAGMLVALLAAGQTLLLGEDGFRASLPLWATLAAVVVGRLMPTPMLRKTAGTRGYS